MIYTFWHQDYDYAGYDIVEGPEGADPEALIKEFRSLKWEDTYEKFYPKARDEAGREFVASHVTAFCNWLVAEKGFSRPKMVETEM
jgi:hypothetical protein